MHESDPDPDGPHFAPIPGYGGAEEFLDFIEQKVRPAVQVRFPQATLEREALYGHSYGGLFSLYALLTRPRSFACYIASSPSIWWNERIILEYARRFLEIEMDDGQAEAKNRDLSDATAKAVEDLAELELPNLHRVQADTKNDSADSSMTRPVSDSAEATTSASSSPSRSQLHGQSPPTPAPALLTYLGGWEQSPPRWPEETDEHYAGRQEMAALLRMKDNLVELHSLFHRAEEGKNSQWGKNRKVSSRAHKTYEGEEHTSVMACSLSRGLTLFFEDWPFPEGNGGAVVE